MPFIPAPNVIQANLRLIYASQRVESVFHYTMDPLMDFQPNALEIGAAVVAAWNTHLKAQMSNQMQLQSIYMTDQSYIYGDVMEYTAGLPLTGSSAADPLPFNVAMVAKKLTGARGRTHRGRTYLCGWNEGHVTVNTFQAAAVTAALAFLNAIKTFTPSTVTYAMAVVSRYFEGQPRVSAVITPVTSFTVDTTVASQRRRLPGRGA